MIGRLSGRRSFQELRVSGHKDGRGPLRVLMRPTTDEISRIAFAVPRRVGNSVVRNRTKRRLRAVVSQLDQRGLMLTGDYLFRVTAPIEHWTHQQLVSTVTELVAHGSTQPAGLAVGAAES